MPVLTPFSFVMCILLLSSAVFKERDSFESLFLCHVNLENLSHFSLCNSADGKLLYHIYHFLLQNSLKCKHPTYCSKSTPTMQQFYCKLNLF